MRLYEFGVGKIVKGVNTTVDVGVGEISKQSKKFGNKVSNTGNPPTNPGGKIKMSADGHVLTEAVDYEWKYDDAASFKVGKMRYNVDFNGSFNGSNFKNVYELEFSAVHGPRYDNNKMMGQSSIQVFSTVIAITKDFILREKPDVIEFVGDKTQNRSDVYTKMIKKYQGALDQLGYDISIDTEKSNVNTHFSIIKRGDDVNEAV